MTDKPGRNDPCPCGSGKKYKQCCALKAKPLSQKKFTAKLLSGSATKSDNTNNLMERTFGDKLKDAPSAPPVPPKKTE